MADGYDRYDSNDSVGGGSFVMGLLTGTVLGAGLGMLFAPKAGSELRNQLTEQAGSLRDNASEGYRKASEVAGEGYRKASETAGEWADKGREAVDKAKDAVSRGAEEAQRYGREATGGEYAEPQHTWRRQYLRQWVGLVRLIRQHRVRLLGRQPVRWLQSGRVESRRIAPELT